MGGNHPIPACELCGGLATIYCPSDSAFLCPSCDSRVHSANFLVSRHPRQPLCPYCHSVSPCTTCSLPFFPHEEAGRASSPSSSSSSSSSSACISTTRSSVRHKTAVSSCPKRIVSGAADEVLFTTWCKRMGIEGHAGSIVPRAMRVLKLCRGRLRALPLRVAAAASLWWGMRKEEGIWTWEGMKRVEEVTGVPGKLILAAEAKLRRAVREGRGGHLRGMMDLREGWAECECGPTN